MTYRVLIDDNFHYMDPEHRYSGPDFDALDDALQHCKAIVDDFLASAYGDGMSAKELVEQYRLFGEDPFVIGGEGTKMFSAWDYAYSRAREICDGGDL